MKSKPCLSRATHEGVSVDSARRLPLESGWSRSAPCPSPAALPHDLHDPTPPSLLAAPSPTPTARRRFRPSMALPMALGTHHALPMDLGTVVTRRPEVRSRISRPREHPMDLVNGPDPSPQCAEPVQVAGV